MQRISAYRLACIVVGCFFAEAAFLLTQILLTTVFLHVRYSLPELLSPDNPFYSLPPHFLVIVTVFLAAVIYGEYRHIRFLAYYIGCAIVAAIAFHIALLALDGIVVQASSVVINMIAAVMSGLVYWFVSLRIKF